MIRLIAAVLALVPLAASAAAPTSDTMSLAEAKRLTPQQLAERLLGLAGASAHYVEANVQGDGGLMIGAPGLNSVDLYRRPESAGFVGLCQVEGVHIQFSYSRYDTPGDPPHKVTDFWMLTRFAMLAPTDKRVENSDWDNEASDCAKLGPVANRIDPVFFKVNTNKPADAYFAMRALAKMRRFTPGLFTCKASNDDPICTDLTRGAVGVPIQNIRFVDLARCPQQSGWCVTATWLRAIGGGGSERHEVEFTIRTDADQVDPPTDFRVTAVNVSAGTSIDD